MSKRDKFEKEKEHEEEVFGEIVDEFPESTESKADPEPTVASTAQDAVVDEAKLAAEQEKYLRLMAEYDNYRKRSVRERENIYTDVRADTVAKFLPVYDNLSRALEQETTDEAYRKGVEMTMTQFNEVMERLGVAPIEALGETFNPELHNAVMHDTDPEKGEGEIVQEFQKGFKLGDRVIRFSVVKTVN